jgi:hypothetical protein
MNEDMKILPILCLSNQIKYHPTPTIYILANLQITSEVDGVNFILILNYE